MRRLALLLLLAPLPARAENLTLGLKAGGVFPQVFSKLGTSYLVDVELGATLPIVQRRVSLVADFGFTQPEADGTTTDPRVDTNGGMYGWHLDQRELIAGLSLVYRQPMGSVWPYVGIGPRLFILQSTVTGQAGMTAITPSTESSIKVGVGVPLGVEVAAGPGRLLGELDVNVAPIDHRTTGDDNLGSLAVAVGYRLAF